MRNMSEMPISEAREHISEMVGRARYGNEPTILTHYGRPAAVVISFEEYQRLKHAAKEVHATEEVHVAETAEVYEVPEYQLPPEIEAVIEESRRHPERDQPRPRRAGRRAR
jgi:prevent-host-death family protein